MKDSKKNIENMFNSFLKSELNAEGIKTIVTCFFDSLDSLNQLDFFKDCNTHNDMLDKLTKFQLSLDKKILGLSTHKYINKLKNLYLSDAIIINVQDETNLFDQYITELLEV